MLNALKSDEKVFVSRRFVFIAALVDDMFICVARRRTIFHDVELLSDLVYNSYHGVQLLTNLTTFGDIFFRGICKNC